MRDFFLGNSHLTSCGVGSRGKYGYVYVCKSCGDAWGKVERLEGTSWFIPLATACANCPAWLGQIPGSFLRPLVWWDACNGNTLTEQLKRADEKLLRYEALVSAKYLLNLDHK